MTLPVQLRRAAGIEPGQTLVAYVEAGRVVIEERAYLLARLQDEAITAATTAGASGAVVDELIAERRAEATREDTEETGEPGRDHGARRQRGTRPDLPRTRPQPGRRTAAGAVVSTVNWAEIVHKLAQRVHPHPATAADGVRALGVRVEPFTTTDAVRASLLWTKTHHAGLSLGDRACLALTQRVPNGRVSTADRAWANLNHDIAVHLIR